MTHVSSNGIGAVFGSNASCGRSLAAWPFGCIESFESATLVLQGGRWESPGDSCGAAAF
jgi:hypothetical protein